MTDPDNAPRRQLGGELIIPILALAFTAYYVSTILESPWTAQVNALLVGSALVLAVMAHLVRLLVAARREGFDLSFGDLLAPRALLAKRLVFALLTLAYLVLIQWGGFTLTTFAYLAAAMVLLSGGRRFWASLAMAAVMALVGFVVFIAIFKTRFPAGPVVTLYKALF